MKDQDGEAKVQRICEILRKETLDPAKEEAASIIERAKAQAETIVLEAKEKVKALEEESSKKRAKEEEVMKGALKLSGEQAVASLKEAVYSLFKEDMRDAVRESLKSEDIITSFLESIIKGVEKEGIEGDLIAYVSKEVSSEKVAESLKKRGIDRLKKGAIQGKLREGVEVKVMDSHLTLDCSDEALTDLLSQFLRDDLQKLVVGK